MCRETLMPRSCLKVVGYLIMDLLLVWIDICLVQFEKLIWVNMFKETLMPKICLKFTVVSLPSSKRVDIQLSGLVRVRLYCIAFNDWKRLSTLIKGWSVCYDPVASDLVLTNLLCHHNHSIVIQSRRNASCNASGNTLHFFD